MPAQRPGRASRQRHSFIRWSLTHALQHSSGKKAWFKTVFGSGKSTPVEEEDAASTGDGGPHNFIKVSAHHKDRKDFDRLVHVQDLEGHQGHVWVVRFSTDGRYLVSGGSDAIVRLWALVTERTCSSFLCLLHC